MLKISKLADYGTAIMSCLANSGASLLSATQVSEETQIPLPTVSKLLKILNEAQLVTSTRGSNGGYQITRPAAEIKMSDIIIAIDGNPALTQCCGDDQEGCGRYDLCAMRGNWQTINNMIFELLRGISLADMLQPLAKPMHFHKNAAVIEDKNNGA